jgi:hypothetical protein
LDYFFESIVEILPSSHEKLIRCIPVVNSQCLLDPPRFAPLFVGLMLSKISEEEETQERLVRVKMCHSTHFIILIQVEFSVASILNTQTESLQLLCRVVELDALCVTEFINSLRDSLLRLV